jgi:hypothetical protein
VCCFSVCCFQHAKYWKNVEMCKRCTGQSPEVASKQLHHPLFTNHVPVLCIYGLQKCRKCGKKNRSTTMPGLPSLGVTLSTCDEWLGIRKPLAMNGTLTEHGWQWTRQGGKANACRKWLRQERRSKRHLKKIHERFQSIDSQTLPKTWSDWRNRMNSCWNTLLSLSEMIRNRQSKL